MINSSDLGYFGLIFIINLSLFFVVHIVYFRVFLINKINTVFTIINLACCGVTGLVGWLAIGPSFSNQTIMIVATIGSVGAAYGLCGLYALLGPIFVDRSVSAAMMARLARAPDGREREDHLSEELGRLIFDKRFIEHEAVGVITRSNGWAQITPKGHLIGSAYVLLGKLLRIPSMRVPDDK